jgi:uncharacterized membrane protein
MSATSSGHTHSHDVVATGSPQGRRRVIVVLSVLFGLLASTVTIGLIALWPTASPADYIPSAAAYLAQDVEETRGVITDVNPYICSDVGAFGDGTPAPQSICATVRVQLKDGPDAGSVVTVDLDSATVASGVQRGDQLRLLRLPETDLEDAAYIFSDFVRDLPLLSLAIAFSLLVVLIARLRGFFAIIGLGFSFLVLVRFLLPGLLTGGNPIFIGITASAAILIVVLYLTHGISIRTTTALIGTFFGLAVAAILGSWSVTAAHLTGAGHEEGLIVRAFVNEVDLTGLLLCGIIIAGLGVLNDVTVTQASAVWELKSLRPDANARRLFMGAMRIGRDHIASAVYTIAFAYTGAALPVLMLLHIYQQPVGRVLTLEAIAEEVVSTLVGLIALVLAVPFTTALGATLASIAGTPGSPEDEPAPTPAQGPGLPMSRHPQTESHQVVDPLLGKD